MQTKEETKIAYINLGNSHNAIVDIEDLPRLSRSRWFYQKHKNIYYAMSNKTSDGRKKVYMHQEVMGTPPAGKEIDHINGNGLDNRKENLRFCSHRENCQASRKRQQNASSMYKGIYWDKKEKKWRARICRLDGTRKHLGLFESELDAARAYDEAATEAFGKFATLNLPKPVQTQDRLFPE